MTGDHRGRPGGFSPNWRLSDATDLWHLQLAGRGGGQDLGYIHGVFLGFGRVADWAAGEQPPWPVGQVAGAVDQLTGRLQPVPAYTALPSTAAS